MLALRPPPCFLSLPVSLHSKTILILLVALLCGRAIVAQEPRLDTQPTPFTVLLDFAASKNPLIPKQALPIWLEGVQVIHNQSVDAGTPDASGSASPITTFRLRLRPMPGLNDSILFRLFFEDLPDAQPTVTGWSETGEQRFAPRKLGAGLGLAASEAMVIETQGVDYLEVEVPGDGSTVTKAFLATLKTSQVTSGFDFAPAQSLADPFGSTGVPEIPTSDTYLFGRVRAMLDVGTVKLTIPKTDGTDRGTVDSSTVQFEFNLESEPLMAMVAFDVSNIDPAAPVQAWVNDEALGAVSMQLPDLADPAYVGTVRPFEKMRFHYAGWVRCQKAIPGSVLRSGANKLLLQAPADTLPVAVRAVELQLKHSWNKLDYNIAP